MLVLPTSDWVDDASLATVFMATEWESWRKTREICPRDCHVTLSTSHRRHDSRDRWCHQSVRGRQSKCQCIENGEKKRLSASRRTFVQKEGLAYGVCVLLPALRTVWRRVQIVAKVMSGVNLVPRAFSGPPKKSWERGLRGVPSDCRARELHERDTTKLRKFLPVWNNAIAKFFFRENAQFSEPITSRTISSWFGSQTIRFSEATKLKHTWPYHQVNALLESVTGRRLITGKTYVVRPRTVLIKERTWA